MKLSRVLLVAVGAVVVVKLLRSGKGLLWESILGKMPDDAPPKWMYVGVACVPQSHLDQW